MNLHFSKATQHAIPNGFMGKVTRLAVPVAIQSALVAILQLADVLMVSDFGKEATASVGIATKWHFVIIMISAGIASANGILVAQYWGKKDTDSAKTVTYLALKYGAYLMLPLTLLIVLGSDTIMLLQTSDTEVIRLGSTYIWYSIPVLMLTHCVVIAESSLRSSGNAMLPLILGGATALINICLNFWLIKGGLGIEPMGVAGAALATTIARLFQVLAIAVALYKMKHWTLSANFLPNPQRLTRSFAKLAVPSTANTIIWAFGTLTYQVIFGHMGTTELAVFSMMGPFEGLCYSAFFGIAVACSVLVGQSLGDDQFAQAESMANWFIKTIFICSVALAIILLIFKQHVLSALHLTSDELYPLASPAMAIFAILLAVRMTNMLIIIGILRAGGENTFCLRMDFIAMWLVGIPFLAIGAFLLNLPFEYVYGLMLTEEIVKFGLCFTRFLKRKWVKNLTLTPA
ncbi:MATE family efflux transporter [Vibrio gallicus]|uniref:MATE family efflux transporter n=1 Tax=Vibrio gallicus TaxID=190897 RepID=UPI0021C3F32E|nr:MATE family efflux transporter [Vibrio gallicus]